MLASLRAGLCWAITYEGSFPRGVEPRVVGDKTRNGGAVVGKSFSLNYDDYPGTNTTGWFKCADATTITHKPTTAVAMLQVSTNLNPGTSGGGNAFVKRSTSYYTSYVISNSKDGTYDMTGAAQIRLTGNTGLSTPYSQKSTNPLQGRSMTVSMADWSTSRQNLRFVRYHESTRQSGFEVSSGNATGAVSYSTPHPLQFGASYNGDTGVYSRASLAITGGAVWDRIHTDAERHWLGQRRNALSFLDAVTTRRPGLGKRVGGTGFR